MLYIYTHVLYYIPAKKSSKFFFHEPLMFIKIILTRKFSPLLFHWKTCSLILSLKQFWGGLQILPVIPEFLLRTYIAIKEKISFIHLPRSQNNCTGFVNPVFRLQVWLRAEIQLGLSLFVALTIYILSPMRGALYIHTAIYTVPWGRIHQYTVLLSHGLWCTGSYFFSSSSASSLTSPFFIMTLF